MFHRKKYISNTYLWNRQPCTLLHLPHPEVPMYLEHRPVAFYAQVAAGEGVGQECRYQVTDVVLDLFALGVGYLLVGRDDDFDEVALAEPAAVARSKEDTHVEQAVRFGIGRLAAGGAVPAEMPAAFVAVLERPVHAIEEILHPVVPFHRLRVVHDCLPLYNFDAAGTRRTAA